MYGNARDAARADIVRRQLHRTWYKIISIFINREKLKEVKKIRGKKQIEKKKKKEKRKDKKSIFYFVLSENEMHEKQLHIYMYDSNITGIQWTVTLFYFLQK